MDLETKAVHTLKLGKLTAPTKLVRIPTFRNATVVDLPAAVLAPGKTLGFDISLNVPEGFKISPDFPIRYLVTTPDKEGILSSELSPSGEEIPKATDRLAISVPLAKPVADKDAFAVTIGIEYVVCKSGNNGVCMPKSVVFKIPVNITEDGKVRLEVAAPASAPAAK